MRFLRFIGLAALLVAAPAWAAEETVSFDPFDAVTIYGTMSEPKEVVLLLSGEAGWNPVMVDMARGLADLDALVVGIDSAAYLKNAATGDKCIFAAGDLESLSKFLQKKYRLREYRVPTLVGYGSGGTLAYASLVQGATGPFSGGLSLGFCPLLKTAKPLCEGRGLAWSDDAGVGATLKPAPGLEVPWSALQGALDRSCDPVSIRSFVEHVPQGELITLPGVGHGFAEPRTWMPRLQAAFARVSPKDAVSNTPVAAAVRDLPLVEVTATGNPGQGFAVLLTGDGGWARLDRDLGAALADRGVPVVGFSTLTYFWTKRTPQQAADDLARVIAHYAAAWGKPTVTLIGYSFGADVMPFLVRRLPADARARVRKVALLGLSDTATFEFSVTGWLGADTPDGLPVAPEIAALRGVPLLCVYGVDETDSACRALPDETVRKLETRGGHHFGDDVAPIVSAILAP